MTKIQTTAIVCLFVIWIAAIVLSGPPSDSQSTGRGTNVDLTGPFLIAVLIIIYRKFKSMQQRIDELADEIEELRQGSASGQSLDSGEAKDSAR